MEKKKNIIIGVCGSIAAYKVCELIRKLIKKNWNVKVIMTENAKNFINPLTLEVLSKNKVYTDMFYRNYEEDHITLSDFASIILICPATANIIGKIASGICDDLLTTTIFSFEGICIFAPSMNENMWKNRIVKENVDKLKNFGYYFIGPEKGELASGKIGIGRLIDIEKIVEFVEKIYNENCS
jgi:phosphopantothenoylcysteine decarboxylase/phosphopantothenate--cysteine ligase